MAKEVGCQAGKWRNPKTGRCEPGNILFEKRKRTDDPRNWWWVTIHKNTVMKGEGHSPIPGHELERQLSTYKVKDRGKTIKRLLKEGYDVIGSSKEAKEVKKLYG